MEAPQQIEPRSLGDYLEVMSKAVFQSGMSWQVVEAKWEGTREAFRGFDPAAVAALTPPDLDSLGMDTRIIRNRRKIEAIVENARQMLALEEEHGGPSTLRQGSGQAGSGQGFRNYLRSHGGFEEAVADIKKRFRFVGDTGAYYFLWVVNEPVPSYEDWCASRGRTPQAHG